MEIYKNFCLINIGIIKAVEISSLPVKESMVEMTIKVDCCDFSFVAKVGIGQTIF